MMGKKTEKLEQLKPLFGAFLETKELNEHLSTIVS